MKKKISKEREYKAIIQTLYREFYNGPGWENFSCGNSSFLIVRDPYKCMSAFEKFVKIK